MDYKDNRFIDKYVANEWGRDYTPEEYAKVYAEKKQLLMDAGFPDMEPTI